MSCYKDLVTFTFNTGNFHSEPNHEKAYWVSYRTVKKKVIRIWKNETIIIFRWQYWLLFSHTVVSDCGPMDCSPPGSSVHGISQAKILKWAAISFSRGSSRRGDWTWVSILPALQADSLPLELPQSDSSQRSVSKEYGEYEEKEGREASSNLTLTNVKFSFLACNLEIVT